MQLNVEFITISVLHQTLINTACLSYHGALVVKRHTALTISGQKQIKKQATAKEHVEILLMFFLCSFFLRGWVFLYFSE